jgi:amidohydrolase
MHYTYLHEHPELSFAEEQTAAYIRRILDRLQIQYTDAGPTGIIGFLPGRDTSRTIALRADFDALPISEKEDHPLISRKPGIMHACGHDLHTAVLLGTAEILATRSLPFNLMFIFQHGEEVLPGGARDIIGNVFFQTHLPEWIIALHAEPDLPVGQLGICPGQYMASGDEISITLQGPGGHAALPDHSTDLILIASHIVVALQQITSRNASPFLPTVLTFGNFRCHSMMNIIPKEVRLEGTFRTFDETWRQEAKTRIRRITTAIAESMGAQPAIEITDGYPCLYNQPEKAEQAIGILKTEFGEKQVIRLGRRMTTEDFARYSQLLPATFIRLGVSSTTHPAGKLHTPEFFPDLTALETGIRTLCSLILNND